MGVTQKTWIKGEPVDIALALERSYPGALPRLRAMFGCAGWEWMREAAFVETVDPESFIRIPTLHAWMPNGEWWVHSTNVPGWWKKGTAP